MMIVSHRHFMRLIVMTKMSLELTNIILQMKLKVDSSEYTLRILNQLLTN